MTRNNIKILICLLIAIVSYYKQKLTIELKQYKVAKDNINTVKQEEIINEHLKNDA